MAEKRVSVRLAAVGGKQVKAEFEGIGDAGKRGFGKASREMEIANARLARFARRAKIAAGIMAAAAVAAGIAMVRSSLQTGGWVGHVQVLLVAPIPLALQAFLMLERFQEKWTRLSGSKTRPSKDLEPGFESTKTEKALAI